MRERAALVLVIFTATASLARATSVHVLHGEVDGWAEDSFEAVPANGHAPAWVELENHGSAVRVVDLRFRPYSGSSDVRRRVTLDGGERRVVSLPIPSQLRAGELSIGVAGKTPSMTPLTIRTAEQPPLLVLGDEDAFRRFRGPTHSPTEPQAASHAAELDTNRAAFMDATHFPDQLAGLVGRRTVFLLDAATAKLNSAQRGALEAYALTGGEIVFAQEAALAPALDTWRATTAEGSEPLGFGLVHVCSATTCSVCVDCAGGERGVFAAPQVTTNPVEAGARREFGERSQPSLLADVGQPAVGAFLAIILLFAFAIGPGNIYVARRWGRHLILVTTPALALTTCSGIAGYGMVSDGLFTLHAGSRAATLLDETNHRATTVGVTGFFAALSPGEVELPAAHAWLTTDASIAIDWSRGTRFGGELIPSRSYREHGFVGVAPSRARLVLAGQSVQNALGGDIDLGLVKINGVEHPLGAIASNGSGPLGEKSSAVNLALSNRIQLRLSGRLSGPLLTRLTEPLAEGEFLVVLSGPPWIPLDGLEAQAHATHHVVRGRLSR